MATRKSSRLAAKNGEGEDPRENRRASIGGALGLTPGKPKGRNLAIAKAAEAATAAAARLDELNAEERRTASQRKKRKSKKARKAKRQRRDTTDRGFAKADAYRAHSRESMDLMQTTKQMLEESNEEKKEGTGSESDPPSLVSPSSGDGENADGGNDDAGNGLRK